METRNFLSSYESSFNRSPGYVPREPLNSAGLNGIVLAFAGVVVAGLGFLFLVSQGPGPCPLVVGTGVICYSTMPRGFSALAYYLATAGSSLLTVGVWRIGIGRERIVTDGSGFVISIGLTVLALGFFASSILPFPSATSVEIGYFLGLLGSGLLIGGMVKMRVGEKRVPGVVQSR